MLVALPDGPSTADLVADALAAKITTLPAALTRTLTWDQGHEMAAHGQVHRLATGDRGLLLRSQDARGSAAATRTPTACLRQYLPRRLDFRTLTQDRLRRHRRPAQRPHLDRPSASRHHHKPQPKCCV